MADYFDTFDLDGTLVTTLNYALCHMTEGTVMLKKYCQSNLMFCFKDWPENFKWSLWSINSYLVTFIQTIDVNFEIDLLPRILRFYLNADPYFRLLTRKKIFLNLSCRAGNALVFRF